MAQSLVDGSWQFGGRDSDIFRSIKFGHPHFGMPSWGAVLDDDQINELVAFIRVREEQSAGGKPPLPDTLETLDYQLRVETITEELETPWGIAFPDATTMLVTERPGRLRIIKDGILSPDPVQGHTGSIRARSGWVVGCGTGSGLLHQRLDLFVNQSSHLQYGSGYAFVHFHC